MQRVQCRVFGVPINKLFAFFHLQQRWKENGCHSVWWCGSGGVTGVPWMWQRGSSRKYGLEKLFPKSMQRPITVLKIENDFLSGTCFLPQGTADYREFNYDSVTSLSSIWLCLWILELIGIMELKLRFPPNTWQILALQESNRALLGISLLFSFKQISQWCDSKCLDPRSYGTLFIWGKWVRGDECSWIVSSISLQFFMQCTCSIEKHGENWSTQTNRCY